jgi:hypothetical protein
MVNFTVLPNVRILDNGKAALITVKSVCIGPEGTPDDHLGILLRQHPSADRIVEYRDFPIVCDPIPRRTEFRYEAARYDRPFIPGKAVVEDAWTECDTYRDENGEVAWWYCMHMHGETDVVLKR